MCLLVHQPKDVELPEDFLEGVFKRNSDGFGCMWSEDGKLHFAKVLPRTAKEFVAAHRKYTAGKETVWHARMRTHGDVDFENCHPYPVFAFEFSADEDPLLLMHNGVLSTGNDRDKTKSDTWHFVRDYLRPLLDKRREMLYEPTFQRMLGGFIGSSNKFATMDAAGRVVIVNKSAGLEFRGAWLSNTYAWDYRKFVPVQYSSSSGSLWDRDSYSSKSSGTKALPAPSTRTSEQIRADTRKKSKKQKSKELNAEKARIAQAIRNEIDEMRDYVADIDRDGDVYSVASVGTLLRLIKAITVFNTWRLIEYWGNNALTDKEIKRALNDEVYATRLLNITDANDSADGTPVHMKVGLV